MSVKNSNRFKRSNPCPICRSYESATRGKGTRCHGFLSDDGRYAHCSREELAGGITQSPNSETYAHLLYGDCRCGTEHNPKADSPEQFPKKSKKGIAAEYDYIDEFGELLYQVCRKVPKGFYQRRLHEEGSWIWALSEGDYAKQPNGDWKLVKEDTPSAYPRKHFEEVRRVLYRLPELLAADLQATVFIVEGEKDANALNQIGLVATTNVGGSGKWRKEYNDYFKNRSVVILPDNDEVGRSHALQVANHLKGIAKSVKIINLPNLLEKGDVSDWLNAGGNAENLRELVKQEMIYKEETAKTVKSNIISAVDLMAKDFPEPKYAVEGLLSEGVTIFAGKPKLGKSWCALGIALAIASGGNALGSIPVEKGNVLYLALEDGQLRLQKRLQLITGNNGEIPEELDFATSWKRLNEGGLEQLEDWLIQHPNARVIFIDTFKRVRPQERGNRQLYDSDYDAIAPLGDLARKYGVSIVVVHHTRKMDSEDPIDLISGSLGLSGSADGVLVLTRSRMSVQCKLHVIGRDFEEQELMLDWESGTYGWKLAGDAEQFSVGKERREIINLLLMDAPTRFTPKKVAQELNRNETATRKIMAAMHKDGQLDNDGSGNYTVIKNTGNYSNSGNSSNSGNYSNCSDKSRNQDELPFSKEGNSVNRSNVTYLADRVTGVTAVTMDFESVEWKERAAILEYESNLSGENSELSSRIGENSGINRFEPEASMSEFDYKRVA